MQLIPQSVMQDGIRNTYDMIVSRAKLLASFRIANLLETSDEIEPLEVTVAAVKLSLNTMVDAAVAEVLETMRSIDQEISRQLS